MFFRISAIILFSCLFSISSFAELDVHRCTIDANILEAQNPQPLSQEITVVGEAEASGCPSQIMVGQAAKKTPAQVYNLFTVYSSECVYNSIGHAYSANDVVESRINCDKKLD